MNLNLERAEIMEDKDTRQVLLTKIEQEESHNIAILKTIFEERYLGEDRTSWIFKGIEEALKKKNDLFQARICMSRYFQTEGALRMWEFNLDEETKDFFTKKWFFNKRVYNKNKPGFEVLEYIHDLVIFNREVDGVLEKVLSNSSSINKVLRELEQYSYEAELVKINKWVYAISVKL